MKLIAGPRGSGRTTRLIKWAAEDARNRILILADDKRRLLAQHRAAEMGLPAIRATSMNNHLAHIHQFYLVGGTQFGVDDGRLDEDYGFDPDVLVITTIKPHPADMWALLELERELR